MSNQFYIYKKPSAGSFVLRKNNSAYVAKTLTNTPTPTLILPTSTPTNTPTPTNTLTPTISVTPTSTLTPTISVTPTSTLTPTPTPTNTRTPTPTNTPTPIIVELIPLMTSNSTPEGSVIIPGVNVIRQRDISYEGRQNIYLLFTRQNSSTTYYPRFFLEGMFGYDFGFTTTVSSMNIRADYIYFPEGSDPVGYVTDYTIQASNDNSSWTTIYQASGLTYSYWLNNDNTYKTVNINFSSNYTYRFYKFVASNWNGTNGFILSHFKLFGPPRRPFVPTNLSATAGTNQSISLSWTSPDNGGSVITNYIVQYSSDSGSTWTTFSSSTSTSTTKTVTGLTNGTSYIFRVAAVNSIGTGNYSSSTDPIMPYNSPGLPGLPRNAALTGNGNACQTWVVLTFLAPTNSGDSAITSYRLRSSNDNYATFIEVYSGFSSFYNGLGTNNPTVRLSALNNSGEGPYVQLSNFNFSDDC